MKKGKKSIFYFAIVMSAIFTVSCGLYISNYDYVSIEEITSGAHSLLQKQEEPVDGFNYWLPLEYDYISDFTDGYGMLEKDGMWLIVDNDYNFIYSTSEYQVINLNQNFICVQSLETFKYGMMDIDGSIIIEPQYDSPLLFSEGLASVVANDRVGYINLSGNLVIDYKYEWGLSFSEGLACRDDVFINRMGEEVLKIPEGYYVDLFWQEGYGNFYLGDLMVVYNENGNKAAVMDKTGAILLASNEFEEIKIFGGNYVAVKKDNKWGVIDLTE